MSLFALIVVACLLLIVLFKFILVILRIPFPVATFFDHRFKRKNQHKQLIAWTNRHGRTFCTMNLLNGFRRNIVSSDPEVLAEVFGRAQFGNFPERKDQTLLPPHLQHVFVASGKHWHHLRKKVLLFFSGRNIRMMESLLEIAVEDMLRAMSAEKGPFDFRSYSNLLFAGILARLAFSTIFPRNELAEFPQKYVEIAMNLLKEKEQQKEMEKSWFNVNGFFGRKSKLDVFCALCKKMRESEQHFLTSATKTDERVESMLGMLLFDGNLKAVGIETVSFALSCAVHFLANHPDIQEQLNLEQCESESIDSPYLLAVIHETLRLCPIVAFASSRLCCASTVLMNGIKLEPGDTVEADIFSMHLDKEVFGSDADKFRPERWLNKDGMLDSKQWRSEWLPFGMGPRGCVGFPLALTLLKLAIGRICNRFRLISIQQNEDSPVLCGTDVLQPEAVMIEVREK